MVLVFDFGLRSSSSTAVAVTTTTIITAFLFNQRLAPVIVLPPTYTPHLLRGQGGGAPHRRVVDKSSSAGESPVIVNADEPFVSVKSWVREKPEYLRATPMLGREAALLVICANRWDRGSSRAVLPGLVRLSLLDFVFCRSLHDFCCLRASVP